MIYIVILLLILMYIFYYLHAVLFSNFEPEWVDIGSVKLNNGLYNTSIHSNGVVMNDKLSYYYEGLWYEWDGTPVQKPCLIKGTQPTHVKI